MSKAFTREDDDLPERPTLPRARPSTAPGVRPSLTPDGARRFQEELRQISGTAGEAGREPRARELQRILQSAVIVPPPPRPWDHVRFGACVQVRDHSGAIVDYRVVGPDEMDLDRGWIPVQSPLGRALVGAEVGQTVQVKLPAGIRTLEVLNINYPEGG